MILSEQNELLAFVRRQQGGGPQGGGPRNNNNNNNNNNYNNTSKSNEKRRCFKCKELGHVAIDCRIDIKRNGQGWNNNSNNYNNNNNGKNNNNMNYWSKSWYGYGNGRRSIANMEDGEENWGGGDEEEEFCCLCNEEDAPPGLMHLHTDSRARLETCRGSGRASHLMKPALAKVGNVADKMREAECQDRLRRQNRFAALDLEDEDLDLPVDGNGTYLLGDEESEKELFELAAVDTTRGRWVKEEAAVDSGSVDNVINGEKFPHLKVEPTTESQRGETWTCAGGKKIPKEGQLSLSWQTSGGSKKRSKLKVGAVGRTLISVSRLHETGHDASLNQYKPFIRNKRTGETIPLRKQRGMFTMDMWIWIPAGANDNAGFARHR